MNIIGNHQKSRPTPQQALLKAASYCAYQERCHQEVIEKLAEWGIRGTAADEILLQLIEQNYVNEERFAIAYAGGKFRTKQWGKLKIRLELRNRNISDYCIQKALAHIEDDVYADTIKKLAAGKLAETSDKNPFARKAKVARFLVGKGFEQNLIWEIINTI